MAQIWIIGASSGIGRSLALAYAQLGYGVFASARNSDALNSLCIEFESLKTQQEHHGAALGSIHAMPMDMTDVQSINDVVAAMGTFSFESGPTLIEKVIINGGTCEYIDELPLDAELFRRVFETNLFGAINCSNAAIPLLQSQQSKQSQEFQYSQQSKTPIEPQLVFVSSSVTYQALPRAHAYGGSKAALRYMAECLKVDLLDKGIDVRLVSPGFVKTPLTDKNDFDMPFMISSDEAAQRIIKGLQGKHFDLAFPRRFTYLLKVLAILPNVLKFKLLSKMTASNPDLEKA